VKQQAPASRLPLRRRDLPQGDLDDGTVGQLLKELAGEMDRTFEQEEAHIGQA
jgi:hypothetical protein